MPSEDHLILSLVRLKRAEHWSFEREGICFVLFKSGSGQCFTAHASRVVGAGDLLLTRGPGSARLAAAKGKPLVFHCFSASLPHLFPLFNTHEIALLAHLNESLRHPRVWKHSDPVAAECHRLLKDAPPGLNLNHRGQLLRVAAAALTDEFTMAARHGGAALRSEDRLVQVFRQLSADELLRLSVADLARKFGCGRRHLSRLFHRCLGFSVAGLRMEARLLKAVCLLRNPDAKVAHVAERCGFNHPGLFNSYFKKRFGASPGLWRRLHAKADAGAALREALGFGHDPQGQPVPVPRPPRESAEVASPSDSPMGGVTKEDLCAAVLQKVALEHTGLDTLRRPVS